MFVVVPDCPFVELMCCKCLLRSHGILGTFAISGLRQSFRRNSPWYARHSPLILKSVRRYKIAGTIPMIVYGYTREVEVGLRLYDW
jgi:hypothetical protein